MQHLAACPTEVFPNGGGCAAAVFRPSAPLRTLNPTTRLCAISIRSRSSRSPGCLDYLILGLSWQCAACADTHAPAAHPAERFPRRQCRQRRVSSIPSYAPETYLIEARTPHACYCVLKRNQTGGTFPCGLFAMIAQRCFCWRRQIVCTIGRARS